ncbi:hypothetical protein FG386_002008 [Cryptosporidium ryanae]|uniref:uncharacterized protein n=1 Tax=Cryptosporidium ryanae TaxID=515981 RepID=UPI00351AA915|nr:hypothetical protein FG386_002008 [Cryptosporidium ryanae]
MQTLENEKGLDTPVGLCYDEFKDTVLVACNESLFCFSFEEKTPGSKELAVGNGKTEFVNTNGLRPSKSVRVGGNIRGIKKSRYGGVEVERGIKDDKEKPTQVENYVLVNRKNYPVILTDFGLRTTSTVHVKNDKDELEDVYSLDFVINAYTSESIMLFGCKNRIYVSDYKNPERVSCINLKKQVLGSESRTNRQKGLVSSLSVKTKGIGCFSVFSSGTFSGSMFLHDLKDGATQIRIFDNEVKMNAITELYWLEDPHSDENLEYLLVSGDRRNDKFYIWDVRKPNKVLCEIPRENSEIDQRFAMCFDMKNKSELEILFGDSKGNLNDVKLYFECEKSELKNKIISPKKYNIDDKSVAFIDMNRRKSILFTLSGDRTLESKNKCTLKLWDLRSLSNSSEQI